MDHKQIDIPRIIDEIQGAIKTGTDSEHIDEMAIQSAINAARLNPSYIRIASHIEIAKMHKALQPNFSDAMMALRDVSGTPLLTKQFMAIVDQHHKVLNEAIIHLRDYDHTYDMIIEFQSRFLTRNGPAIIERIQHMFMRMAVAIHMDDIPSVLETYDLLSSRQVVYDSSMSLNAGIASKPISSIYSVAFSGIGIREMYDAIAECVFAVRNGGKVSISAQGVPCSGRNGTCHHEDSNIGIWAMLKLLDGAIAFARRTHDTRVDLANVCVEPWHIDIRSLLEFNNIHQHDLSDQKSLTISLSTPDIFMSRVEDDQDWSLFCPHDVPDLLVLKGRFFDDAYTTHEASKVPRVTIRARDLWDLILKALIVTGGPSIIFKDTVNRKFDTLGVQCELSPRNHASITLPLLVTATSTFDFGRLQHITRELVFSMNKVFDANMGKAIGAPDINKDYRAVAIGIHGLADVFAALRMPYDSAGASALNGRIAETIYYTALDASCDLAEKHGPYAAFSRSSLARGTLQFDMWSSKTSNTYLDWATLRNRIHSFGVRNAVMIAIGPGCCPESSSGYTASTDPPSSNIQNDNVVCPWLVEELIGLGIWNNDMREQIFSGKGSIQDIEEIPADIKLIYRTAWEIEPETLIRMAMQRAPFVCHSESLSLYLEAPTPDSVGELLMRTWASGLKTGLHKLHTRSPEYSKATSSYDSDSDREMSFEDAILSGDT
ncbi:ribonucleotide reductase [Mycena epipterygia]|nr:ribonucleotide reductase [Mycena epipterygia]